MAVDLFINMGADIKGDTVDEAQKKTHDIDVLAWSWGMSQSGTTHMGPGGGAGKANFQDLSFTKYVDSASNAIMVALAKGTHIPKCTLMARRAGKGQIKYLEIIMEEVMVTSVSTGGSGGEERFTENVTLNFAKVTFNYIPQKGDGTADAAKPFTWNIAANSANLK
jgi:type VI secretion system secreted protein Hcp